MFFDKGIRIIWKRWRAEGMLARLGCGSGEAVLVVSKILQSILLKLIIEIILARKVIRWAGVK